MVTCSPEIDIRWLTPVRAKSCHSSASMARWSPIASAMSTPANGRSGRALRKRSRTAWRRRSMAYAGCGTNAASRCGVSRATAAGPARADGSLT